MIVEKKNVITLRLDDDRYKPQQNRPLRESRHHSPCRYPVPYATRGRFPWFGCHLGRCDVVHRLVCARFQLDVRQEYIPEYFQTISE